MSRAMHIPHHQIHSMSSKKRMERESTASALNQEDDDNDSHNNKKPRRNDIPRHSIPNFNLESEETTKNVFDNVEKGNYVQNISDTGLVPSDIQVLEDEIGNPPKKSLLDLWLDAEVSMESFKPTNNQGTSRAQSHSELFHSKSTFDDEDLRLIQVSYVS